MRSPDDQPAALSTRPVIRTDDRPGIIRGLRMLARAMLAMTEQDTLPGAGRLDDDRRRLGQLARALHRERARREEFFSGDLFAEPAWDILLDLFAAKRASELRSIKAVCLSSHVPEATALRYIELLAAQGLVERTPDRFDRRRKYLSLTALGERRMQDYLASMPPLGDLGEDLLRFLVLSN